MEVKNRDPIWLDQSHPNYLRWKQARELSIERGKFVKSIVNKKICKEGLSVLDLGSGEGGTAKVFSENNFVVSFDLNLIRLQRQKIHVIPKESSTEESVVESLKDFSFENLLEMTNPGLVNGTALQLPFCDQAFDLIIIQDVIEHLSDLKDFLSEIKRVLKTNGFIFLSTPNRFSIFNFFSDPHFGLPIISLLNRESAKNYFLKYFRMNDSNRTDIAQLLSLKEIKELFNSDFKIILFTTFSVKELFNGNKGIVWSVFHLKLIALCKFVKFDWVIKKAANDKFGIINKFFTPTYYFLLRKY